MTPTKHNPSKSVDKKSRAGRAREPGADTAPVKKDDPARDKAYRFTYVGVMNRIKGAVAGTAIRPIAIR